MLRYRVIGRLLCGKVSQTSIPSLTIAINLVELTVRFDRCAEGLGLNYERQHRVLFRVLKLLLADPFKSAELVLVSSLNHFLVWCILGLNSGECPPAAACFHLRPSRPSSPAVQLIFNPVWLVVTRYLGTIKIL